MKKLTLITVLVVFVLAGLVSAVLAERRTESFQSSAQPVPIPTPSRQGIQNIEDVIAQIEKDAAPIKAERTECLTEQANLAAEEKRLIATAELLTGAIENYKRDSQAHSANAAAQRADAAAHDEAQRRHDANQCTYPAGHPEVCAAYNAEAQRLDDWAGRVNEWGKRINDAADTLDMRGTGLEARRKDLNDGTLDWARRKKENNANLDDLETRERALVEKWRGKLHLPEDIETLADLKRVATMCEGAIRACVSPTGAPKPCSDEQLENMKYCTNIQWDGDRPGRPPLRSRKSSQVE